MRCEAADVSGPAVCYVMRGEKGRKWTRMAAPGVGGQRRVGLGVVSLHLALGRGWFSLSFPLVSSLDCVQFVEDAKGKWFNSGMDNGFALVPPTVLKTACIGGTGVYEKWVN